MHQQYALMPCLPVGLSLYKGTDRESQISINSSILSTETFSQQFICKRCIPRMKLIFAVAVSASAILLLVLPMETQGAPSQRGPGIASEEVGKVVEELRGLLAKSMSADSDVQYAGNHRETMTIAQRFPNSQHRAIAQQYPWQLAAQGKLQQSSEVTAQVAGVIVEDCGEPFTSIINIAFGVLNVWFGGQFGVLVNCGISSNCVQVQVDVPANNVLTDIDVCRDPSSKCIIILIQSCILMIFILFRWCNMCADLR